MSQSPLAVVPVILSGGAGTRLWPVSRSLQPKQLLPIVAAETMLQATVARLPAGAGFAAPIVVGGEGHRFLIADQLAAVDVTPQVVILEPEGRNTAAAIALAAHHALATAGDAVLVVMPSDHVIAKPDVLRRAVAAAVPAALAGHLVAFGIKADRPETGYGYIESGAALDGSPGVNRVARFVEKPAAALAEAFVADGRHTWNGGIFVFTAQTYLDALATHAPAVAAACSAAMAAAVHEDGTLRPDRAAFVASPNISVDYAVMERTDRAAVVPVEMGWSDVGSWDALWEISAKDAAANAVSGDAVLIDTSASLIRVAEGGAPVAAVGVEGLVIVSMRDAVLVADRGAVQDVKRVVAALNAQGATTATAHAAVERPWGSYETTASGSGYQTKRIVVKPGGQLSLQLHHRRSEHWVVVAGTARVTVGDRVVDLVANESIYIPVETRHRLENFGTVPVVLIEVQCGPYLGEDDIVRFEDVYGRAGTC